MLATLTIFGWIRFGVAWAFIIWGIRELIIDFYRHKCKKAYFRGDVDRMEKAIGKILKIKPNDFYGLGCKGLVYDIKGQYDKIQEIGDRLLEIANNKKKKESRSQNSEDEV